MATTHQPIGGLPDSDSTVPDAHRCMSLTRRVLLVGCLSVFLAAVLSAYAYSARRVVSSDPFIYGNVAKAMLHGKRLYADVWEGKPPLGMMLYAVPQLFVQGSYVAMLLFLGLWLAAEGLIFYIVLRRELPAALCCVIFVTLFPLTYWDFCWPSTEHFSNPFVAGLLLLAYVMVRDRTFTLAQCVLIGVLAVVAFHIRQNAAVAAVVPLASVGFSPQPWRQKALGIAAMAMAALLCWALVLLLVISIGDLHGYFYVVFTYPRVYAQAGGKTELVALASYGANTLLPLVALLFAGLALLGKHRWFVAGLMVVGIALCPIPWRGFPHYWVNLFPFVALCMGIGLQRQTIPAANLRWTITAAISLAVILSAAAALYETYLLPSYIGFQKLAAIADQVAPPGSTLFVCGPYHSAAVVFASSLPPAHSRYWFSYEIDHETPELLLESRDAICDDYLKHPPGVIVIEQDWANDVLHPASPTDTTSVRLIRTLATRYRYVIKGTVVDYLIMVRDPSLEAATLANTRPRPAPATEPATRPSTSAATGP
ncbi:MAG: hypothetical protein ABR964_04495 [Tepidisphaeraceae bacterium]|jgi:hypothetical protein